MNKTSSIVTGGLTVSAASLVPAVEWVLSGCHTPVPASVSALVAGLLASGIHALYNYGVTRMGGSAEVAAPSAGQQ